MSDVRQIPAPPGTVAIVSCKRPQGKSAAAWAVLQLSRDRVATESAGHQVDGTGAIDLLISDKKDAHVRLI